MSRDTFSIFASDTVASKTAAQVCREWCVSPSTLRGWCDNSASPTVRQLFAILGRMNDSEFLRFMRLAAGERVNVQLRDHDAIDESAGQLQAITACGDVVTLAAELSVTELKAIADGKIDPHEQVVIDLCVDRLEHKAEGCRPWRFPRLLMRIPKFSPIKNRLLALAR